MADVKETAASLLQLANLLTIIRLLLSPVLFWLVYDAEATKGTSWTVFGIGLVIAASDYLDGWVARKAGSTSRGGALLDPLADKVVILGVGYFLVIVGRYWWLPVAMIAVRELGITIWRTYWLRKGIVVPARKSAKYKTSVQGAAFLLAVLPPLENAYWIVVTTLWLAVVFTLVTGFQYILDGSTAIRDQDA